MGRTLTFILLTTFLLSSVMTTAVLAVFIGMRPADINNRHCDMSSMGYFICGLGCIVMALATLPVYFNLLERVHRSYLLSLLSFLLLPLVAAISFAASFQILSLTVSAPYLGILMIQFFRFKKQNPL